MSEQTIASPNAAPDGFWASKRRNEKITKIVVSVLLIIGAFVMMLPIAWMLSTSFKTRTDVFAVPPVWIPSPLHFENYPTAWTLSGMYAGEDWSFLGITFHGITFTTYIVNTLTISVLSCLGATLSSSLVAFAFARLRFPGRGPLFLCAWLP